MCRVKSVSPEQCTCFYAIWCMVWGTLIGSGYTLILIAEQLKLTRTMQLHQRMLSIAFAILGLSYLLAGALIYIGMECNKWVAFKCGKLLSYAFAMASLPVLLFTIVHFSTMRCLCQYMRRRWKKG
ncbi:uncharacterized protein [Drosophila suzukii]|uniref:Uncharacterized protein n=1 Tax=Drosophila suzukii TaxID=28584 RepID=A0AB39Z4F5_DROSZ|nr:uncharacterized protein LOC108008845 [Drosophila suzukii]